MYLKINEEIYKMLANFQFYFALFTTGSYFLIELIFGIITNSLALKADAFHMLSDLIAIIIAFSTNKLSHSPKTEYATYGWARTEILGGVINSVFLLSSTLSIFIELVQRFFYIDEVSEIMDSEVDKLLIVAIIGLVVNIVNFMNFQIGHCIGLKSGHGHSHVGHSHDVKSHKKINLNLKAMMLHILGDTLGSVGVIITALGIKFVNTSWIYYLDPLCSLFIITIIICGTTPVLLKCIRILSQNSSRKINIPELKNKILDIPPVLSIHELHVWRLDPMTNIATVHIYTEDIGNVENTIAQIKTLFHSYGIHSTTVQPEFQPKCTEPICETDCLDSRCCVLETDTTEVNVLSDVIL